MSSSTTAEDLPCRQRVFRRVVRTLLVLQVAALGFSFTEVVSPGIETASLLLVVLATGAWFVWGVRWVKAAQPAVSLTSEQIDALGRARTIFVRRYGVLGFGLLWGSSMALWDTWSALSTQPISSSAPRLLGALAAWVPAGLLAGYLWGRTMWRVSSPRTDSGTDAPPPA